MKKLSIVAIIAGVLLFAVNAMAGINYSDYDYHFDFSSSSSIGLEHSDAYYWGINIVTPEGDAIDASTITSAVLEITDLRNWQYETNNLYISLLDNSDNDNLYTGVTSFNDYENSFIDYNRDFSGYNLLTTYSDKWTDYYYRDTLIYNFDDGNSEVTPWWSGSTVDPESSSEMLTTLKDYIEANGYIGIGLDPDCHYYASGITLYLAVAPTAHTPEPATMILFGTGLVALGGMARRRLKNNGRS